MAPKKDILQAENTSLSFLSGMRVLSETIILSLSELIFLIHTFTRFILQFYFKGLSPRYGLSSKIGGFLPGNFAQHFN